MSSDPNTKLIATQFVAHSTNEKGELLANVFESEAFQSIFDPHGIETRKVRLPRKQEQIFNRYDTSAHLFQKLYYHPALLQEDETQLRQIFFRHNSAHETTSNLVSYGSLIGLFPALYYVSRSVRPTGCFFFSLAYAFSYFKVIKPLTGSMLQSSLNRDAKPFAEKYGVTADDTKYFN